MVYRPLHFDVIVAIQSGTLLGMLLDVKLNLQGHLKSIYSKFNKAIGHLRKFHSTLPRLLLLTIYKSFIMLHLGYYNIWCITYSDITEIKKKNIPPKRSSKLMMNLH